VGFQIFFFGAHLAEFRAEFLENFLSGRWGRSSRRRLAALLEAETRRRIDSREARRKLV